MRIEQPTAERVVICTGDIAVEMAARAGRSHLTGVKDSRIAALAARMTPEDWQRCIGAARLNRLMRFVAGGLADNAIPLPPDVGASFQHHRQAFFHLNSRNLMTLKRIVPMVERSGIEAVVIKGPLQQRLVYGDFFAKPGGDVDLLVHPKDFGRTRDLIVGAGYGLPPECASPWWSMFLGEQHLLAEGLGLSTIDLHHRVQQPGAPSPIDLDDFFQRVERVDVGGARLPTLCLENAMLLQCMTIAKALIHREPAGGYIADLLASLTKLPPAGLEAFLQAAARQGLRNTVRLGLRSVDVLFGVRFDNDLPGEARVLDHTTDDDLLAMLVTPGDEAILWPKRRTILWELNDRGALTYTREVGWAIGGEAARRLFNRHDGGATAAPAATA